MDVDSKVKKIILEMDKETRNRDKSYAAYIDGEYKKSLEELWRRLQAANIMEKVMPAARNGERLSLFAVRRDVFV